MCTKARTPGNTDNQLKLEEAKMVSPFQTSEGRVGLDFGFPASRTGR